MRALMLTGLKEMQWRDVPTPELRSGDDVLLKMAVVGVCGSDIHYHTTGRIGSQVVQYPFTVGHEGSAVVERVGARVTRVKPGDLVAVEPAMSCGLCDQCRHGRPHTCRQLRFLGCPGQAEGCLSEYLVMPQACCVPARGLTADQAALSEPLAIGYYAARRALPLKGARVAILGAGPIGLSVLLCALARGARTVYVTDKIAARRAAARRAGASWSGDPDSEDIVAAIAGREPRLLDAVFECCGDQPALDQAVDILAPGGRLLLVGIPETERISLMIDRVRRKELDIINIRRQCHCLDATLRLMQQGVLNADFMVTHRFTVARAQAAFDTVAAYRDGVIKAMIQF